MKIENPNMKTTIDGLCKQPAGSFKQFVKEKEGFLESLENDRKQRIKASRKASVDLSWAA